MTKETFWRASALVVAIAAVAGIWRMGVEQAVAQQGAESCCVGTIDLNGILAQLDERLDREAELQAFITEREDALRSMGERIQELEADLEILPPNGDDWRTKREEILRERARTRMERELSSALAEEKQTLMQLELFAKINDAAARYAAQNGISLVIADDSSMQIPAPQTPEQLRQAQQLILSRRIIHRGETTNISDDVARQMNVEYSQ